MSQRASLAASGQLIPAGKWGRITDINAFIDTSGSISLYLGEDTSGAQIWMYSSAAPTSISLTSLTIDFDDSGVYAEMANVEPLIVHGEWGGGMPDAVISGG